ncbi:hypothetical protein H0H92_010297 [Tricholoma furcatifolium]|nr:hypothetical protein H0H92_010297 [Tricholoma furcatifolium]
MSEDPPIEPCSIETPLPRRKRVSSYASVSKLSSLKRRRMSMMEGELDFEEEVSGASTLRHSSSVDRFIPLRPKTSIPLNVTPRTQRISRQFGLSDARIFNFNANEPGGSTSEDSKTFSMLRRSASMLFNTPQKKSSASVVSNLDNTKRQQCLQALDGPGMSQHPNTTPITWSQDNYLAVACASDVYYQDLDTRNVNRLCSLQSTDGQLLHIGWGSGIGQERKLALGTSRGVVQVWDAGQGLGTGSLLRRWRDFDSHNVGALDWREEIIAVGLEDGSISLFDHRCSKEVRRVSGHKAGILGLKWKMDGSMIASSDDSGAVHIWDKRAGKELFEDGTRGPRMRHRGPVKALAWCPWKSDLLATGSLYPEGMIRIWSSTSPSALPTPTLTLSLDNPVMSLHWSPHCKELLSTHGFSFEPLPPSRGLATVTMPTSPLKLVFTPLTNSITVHEYPSGKRLLNLTSAHFAPVSHSCLSPNGEDLFTACPKEESIKRWHVWNKRQEPTKKASAFDKWTIR